MLHEVLRDRLMMYVNHAHIYIKKMSQKSELGAIYIVTTSLMLHWCFSLTVLQSKASCLQLITNIFQFIIFVLSCSSQTVRFGNIGKIMQFLCLVSIVISRLDHSFNVI